MYSCPYIKSYQTQKYPKLDMQVISVQVPIKHSALEKEFTDVTDSPQRNEEGRNKQHTDMSLSCVQYLASKYK